MTWQILTIILSKGNSFELSSRVQAIDIANSIGIPGTEPGEENPSSKTMYGAHQLILSLGV